MRSPGGIAFLEQRSAGLLHIRISLRCDKCHDESVELTTSLIHRFLTDVKAPGAYLKAALVEAFQRAGAEEVEPPCEHIGDLVVALLKEE